MTGAPWDGGGSGFDWRWDGGDSGWVRPVMDTSRPSVARMYDYYLGGKDNFAVDREAAERVVVASPNARLTALANRQFLIDSVEMMVTAGIRQFLDLGTGIPTSPSVHEVARKVEPAARVVYVDHDPMVQAHNRALLARHEGIATVHQDLRQPSAVLDDPAVCELIDFGKPLGLLCVAVLHFVRHDIAPTVLARYRKVMVPGSFLAVSAACQDDADPAVVQEIQAAYESSNASLVLRTRAQIEQLFDGFELVEPGLASLAIWPEGNSGGVGMLGGVGCRGELTSLPLSMD